MRTIEADFNRSPDTHLIPVPLPAYPGVDLYLKDDSSHPTGSLKHRLARSLFLYSVCNGWLHRDSTVVQGSSGSTALSEAYFARLLGLPFVAVMPRPTSPEKIEAIRFYGGRCHLVDNPNDVYGESERLAAELGGHYMDQFTYAERATDWRSNNNIAESIFAQMAQEPHPVPNWIVCGCGTGGTNFIGALQLAQRMHLAGTPGSIVTILCDGGERYSHSYPEWLSGHGLSLGPALDSVRDCARRGSPMPWKLPEAGACADALH